MAPDVHIYHSARDTQRPRQICNFDGMTVKCGREGGVVVVVEGRKKKSACKSTVALSVKLFVTNPRINTHD